jgi:hypothetical protein
MSTTTTQELTIRPPQSALTAKAARNKIKPDGQWETGLYEDACTCHNPRLCVGLWIPRPRIGSVGLMVTDESMVLPMLPVRPDRPASE